MCQNPLRLPPKPIKDKGLYKGLYKNKAMNMMRNVVMTIVAIVATVCANGAPTSGDKNPGYSALDDSGWRGGPTEDWFVNWDKALAEAKKTNKKLFLLNTGSDWCHWCKKLREEVLDKPDFSKFAAKNLVLVYLDSPNRNPLGKEPKAHNRQIVKALPFGGGVPNVLVMNAKGEKLGAIGGGGLAVDQYIEKLRGIISANGERVAGNEARRLFTDGYAALAAEIAARRAALPPVTKEDFKAKLTGVAVVDDNRRNRHDEATFVPPETPLEVPYGKTVLFRVEYDFPEGYGARVWTRDVWPPNERRNSYYFGSNPSGLYKGKGTAYGFLSLLDRGKACRLKSVQVNTNSDPELDDYPHGWDILTASVDLDFKEKPADWDAKLDAKRPLVSKYVPKGWTENFEAARKKAAKEGKFVLVAFSGSDWCGPCMSLEKDVLSQGRYMGKLSKKYVPMMVSVPRDKTTLSKLAVTQNDALTKRYAIRGFPTVVVVNPADGEEVKRHSGYRSGDPDGYLKQLDGMMKGVKWPAKGQEVKPLVPQQAIRSSPTFEATEVREGALSAWMTDCGEAQKIARTTGKLMLVYNYPRSLLRYHAQAFHSNPDFLKYATNRYVLLSIDGFGEKEKEAFPWAYNSGWPTCRILDAEGTLLSADGNSRSRSKLGNSDYFNATGGQMLDLLKGFDKARQVMPGALPKAQKEPSSAELAKLHDVLSQLPETFVNNYYLKWAERLVAADPDGSLGYRASYPYAAKVYPRIKELVDLKRRYYSTLYGQTRKRIQAEGGNQGGRNWSRNMDIVAGEMAEEWEPKFADAVRQLNQMESEVPDGDSRFRFDNFKRDIGMVLDKLRKIRGTSK